MLRRRAWSFRTVLLLTMLAVVAVPMTFVGTAAIVGGRRAVQGVSQACIHQALVRAEAQVRLFLRTAIDHDALHRQFLPPGDLRHEDILAVFARLEPTFTIHKELTYLGLGLEQNGAYWLLARKSDGRVVIRTFRCQTEEASEYVVEPGGQLRLLPERVRVTPRDCRKRPYYEIAKKEGKSSWTDIYTFHNIDFGSAPGVTFATPIYKDSQLVGVIDSDYDIRALGRFVDDLLTDVPGWMFLVEERSDGTREIILGPTERGPPRSIRDQLHAAVRDQFLARLEGESVEDLSLETAGIRFLVGHRPLGGPDMPRWHLVLAVPEEEVLVGVRATTWLLGIAFVASLAITVLAAIGLSGRLSRPLMDLRHQAQALAAGADAVRAQIVGPRDLADLAQAFNEMAQNVQRQRTELLKRHEQLCESEARFRDVFDNSDELLVIFRVTPEGDLYYEQVNAAVARDNPGGAKAFVGQTPSQILPRHLSPIFLDKYLVCLCSRQPWIEEHCVPLPGGPRWFHTALVPICGADGIVCRLASLSRDITTRIQADVAIRASQELFFKAFQASHAAMSLTRISDRKHIEVNPVWERLAGVSRAQAVGRTALEIGLKMQPDGTDWAYSRLATGKTLHNVEVTVETPGKCPVVGLLSGEAIDLNGEPSVLWVFNDITERKIQEQALLSLNATLEARVEERTAQLAAANRELEAFAYSVSHDLRAPLRSVDGFSKALLEDYEEKFDADGRDYLRRVRAAARRMGELIDDLLQLSRVSRGELMVGPVDLSTLARRVAESLVMSQPGRQVHWDIAEGIRANGDPNLLRVVLENLLGNAWKYTGKHDTARIEFGARVAEKETVYFVKDDGAGFDPSFINKLFQPFQRLHRSEEFEGHGVGLATVQRVIHRHGGRVWAEGQVERGATFFFTLGGVRP